MSWGGVGAVSDSKARSFEAASGVTVHRIDGRTRWETARLVGEHAAARSSSGPRDGGTGTPTGHSRTPDGALWPTGMADCDGEIPVVVASDSPAQSDIYAAVTLAGVVGTSCLVDAGHRGGVMPVASRAALLDAAASGYVVGGETSVSNHKLASLRLARLTGSSRWDTALNVGRFAAGALVADAPPNAYAKVDSHSTGYGSACGLRLDGTLRCWQVNSSYSLPDDPDAPLSDLTEVTELTDWEVPAGSHLDVSGACAVERRGGLRCWYTESGDRLRVPDIRLVDVEVRSGNNRKWCGITPEGLLVCGDFGSQQIERYRTRAESVSFYGSHACAVLVNRSVRCWAGGDFDSPHYSPRVGKALMVSAGHDHGCALTEDSRVRCWWRSGYDYDCERTDYYEKFSDCPDLPTAPPGGKFATVASGSLQACAVRFSKEGLCWGAGLHGEGFNRLSSAAKSHFTQVSMGRSQACGTLDDGRILCTGLGYTSAPGPFGVLGLDAFEDGYIINP